MQLNRLGVEDFIEEFIMGPILQVFNMCAPPVTQLGDCVCEYLDGKWLLFGSFNTIFKIFKFEFISTRIAKINDLRNDVKILVTLCNIWIHG